MSFGTRFAVAATRTLLMLRILLGTVIGAAVGYVAILILPQTPESPPPPWTPFAVSPGAQKILAYDSGVYVRPSKLFVADAAGGTFACAHGDKECPAIPASAVIQEREACVTDELPLPPPPDTPVDVADYFRCMPDASEHLGFAIMSDGSIWYWVDFDDPYVGYVRAIATRVIVCSGTLIGLVAGIVLEWWRRRRTTVSA